MWRYYLMMGVVIVSLFAGFPWFSLLAIPIFMSALIGIKIEFNNIIAKENKFLYLNPSDPKLKDAA